MSGHPSWKSAEIGLFRPFSAFFALFRRVRRAPGKSRKRRKSAFFLRYPRISLNPYLLNPHLRHSNLISVSMVLLFGWVVFAWGSFPLTLASRAHHLSFSEALVLLGAHLRAPVLKTENITKESVASIKRSDQRRESGGLDPCGLNLQIWGAPFCPRLA